MKKQDKIQKINKTNKMSRGLAFIMSFVLLFTSVDMTAFAVTSENENKNENKKQVITGIEELAEDILSQKLEQGASFEAVKLPEQLKVTVLTKSEEVTAEETVSENESAGENAVAGEQADIPVTWNIDTEKSSAAAFSSEEAGANFVYAAKLSEEYELAEEVTLPEITVLIEEADAIEKDAIEDSDQMEDPMRAEAGDITLYTGGGVIGDRDWTIDEQTPGKYIGSENVSKFPTPTMFDTATTFEGWYEDSDYTTKAEAIAAGGTYYAKWTRTSNVVTGDTMRYSYTARGVDAVGILQGNEIQTSYGHEGFVAYYKAGDASAAGTGTRLPLAQSGDVFVRADGDLYVAQVVSFEGAFARYSYYIWNKGDSDVTDFNLGMAVDVQVGNNDFADLKLEEDAAGKYVCMTNEDTALRLYYTGSQVSPVSTLWTGRYSGHRDNVFNDNQVPQTKIDSTMALSWKNISVPPKGVVVQSFLLGCGDADSLDLGKTIKIDPDGDGVMEEIKLGDGEVYTFPEAPVKPGYIFLGWNTKEDGKGSNYLPGDTLLPSESMTFYIQWKEIENTAEVALKLDELAWSGQTVELYQEEQKKYDLTEKENGIYQSTKVINGNYDIYVNGRKSDKGLSFAATTDAQTAKETVSYYTLNMEIAIDGIASNQGNVVTLRKGSTVVYTLSGQNGHYTQVVQASEGSYDIFVDGVDTEVNISSADPSKVIDFYAAIVKITDDTPWKDARVELRDFAGNLVAVLAAGDVEGNTVTYSKVMSQMNEELSIYVNGKNTFKKIGGAAGTNREDLNYYTASVTLKGDIPSPVIHMTNGAEYYNLTGSGENYKAEHVLLHEEDGSELNYIVTVDGTLDHMENVINSQKKAIKLQYWVAKFYNLTASYAEDLLKTLYIREGNTIPVYGGKVMLSAYTFAYFSETKWTPDNKTGGEAFDFSEGIHKNVNLYANYTSPTVTIGELVYTDRNGKTGDNVDHSILYYRMGNLTITGFDPGKESIKYIYLTTENTTSIKFLSTANITVMNGSKSVAVNGGAVSVTPSSDKVAITFTTPVSMAEAQDFLRNQVVVEPVIGSLHTMQVEVTDKDGKYVAINGVNSAQATNSLTQLKGGTSQSLSSGNYYVTGTVTYNSGRNYKNGLQVNANSTVYIYLAEGAKLYSYGSNGFDTAGGGAGIYVPSKSKIIFVGKGTVYAYGGSAGEPTNGEGGKDSTVDGDKAYLAAGGAGGNGGGGGGAGIGTNGGNGGTGGHGGYKTSVDKDDEINGNSGGDATGSLGAAAAGEVYKSDSVTINAYKGAGGTKGGSGGTAGSSDGPRKYGSCNRGVAGGAGGGGGGAGYPGVDIGSGGGGGAGGGGGGSAGYVWTGEYVGAGGGGAGLGYKNGGIGYASSNGSFEGNGRGHGKDWLAMDGGNPGGGQGAKAWARDNDNHYSYGTAGSGGSGAASGGEAVAGSAQTLDSATKQTYKISFVTASSTATKPSTLSYNYGEAYKLTLPEYQDSDPNVIFYGWQVQKYAKSGVSGSAFTSNASTRYQGNTSYDLDPTTTGDIIFVAVTETIGGVRDEDGTDTTIPEGGVSLTYYTYNVTLETDDEITPKGTIQIGDQKVAPSADGTYTLIAADKTKKPIKVNGQNVGTTADFGLLSSTSDTTIAYETMKVSVTGKEPKTVSLTGSNAPALSEAGSTKEPYVYTAERLSAAQKGSFAIVVDGEATGKEASYGAETTVAYNTLTVHVNANGLDSSEITSVELRPETGKALFLTKNADGNFVYTKQEEETSYVIYVNGETTEQTADFATTKTVNVAFNRYTTLITTELDDVAVDMGTVRLGDKALIHTGKGTYQLITTEATKTTLSVDGKVVRTDFTPGTRETISYYTLTYAMSGESGQTETGKLPADETWYLKGTETALLAKAGLMNGGKTFAGWTVNGKTKVYKPGEKISMTGTMTAYAAWERTTLEDAEITLNDTLFTYNAQVQIPEVTVREKGVTLVAGRDYRLKYQNSNTSSGRNNAEGSTVNAINAGDVTITVEGINDYTGEKDAAYVITPKNITVQNLKAVDREYDGTTKVSLTTDRAYLQGVEAGDEVNLSADSVGNTYSPNARDNKYVVIGDAQIEGNMASNYDVAPVEAITVNIAKKPLTTEMFAVENASYDGTNQTPQVTATDLQTVEQKKQNLILTQDYAVEYADNIHAGTASVTMTATEDGNYKGSVVSHFDIAKAPLTITAIEADSSYGAELADVAENYEITSGIIYTEADKEDLAIKAITTVQKGYDVKAYEDAVKIQYNTANTDYAVDTVSAKYTVTTAGNLKVLASGYTGIYDGKEHGITVTPEPFRLEEEITVYYSTTQELTGENYTSGTTTAPKFSEVGLTTVYYYAVSGNYSGTAGSKTVSIKKAPLTITTKPHTITYGENPENITASLTDVTIEGLIEGDTAKEQLRGTLSLHSTDYAQYNDVGTFTLTASGMSADNYTITCKPGTLQVMPKAVTFDWSRDTVFTYTGSEQGITANVSGLVNGDKITAVTDGSTAKTVGSYSAKVTGLSGTKAGNYTFAEETAAQSWSIEKADNSWTITPAIQGWDVKNPANEPVAAAKYGAVSDIHFTYAQKPTESGAEVEYSETKPTEAGTYLMMAAVAGTDNYNALTLDTAVEFTITEESSEKITVYATAEDKTITYGEAVGTVTVHYTDVDGNAVAAEDLGLRGELTYTTDYQKGDNTKGRAGQYLLMPAGQTSESVNLVSKPGTLTVAPKEVSLTWSATELTYTGTAQSVTATVDLDSILPGDSIVVASYEGNEETAVGNNYTATALSLTGAGAGNYKLPQENTHNWKITEAVNEFIIQPGISDWTYGDTASTPVASAKFGEVTFQYKEKKEGILDWGIFNPETAEVPSKAGEYVLVATVKAGEGYGELKSEETTFKITPAEIVITANDGTSQYGETIQSPLSYGVKTLKGKITDADKESLNIGLTVQANVSSPAAIYPIVVTYRENSNITVETVPGVYTISAAELSVSAEDVTAVYDGKAHKMAEPTVTAGGKTVSTAKIYYSTEVLNSQNYGSADQTSPTITDVGTQTIYYYVTAENYAAKTGSVKVTVTQKEVTVKARDAQITYGDAAANQGAVFTGFIGDDSAEQLNLAPKYHYTYADNGGSSYGIGSPAGAYVITPSGLSAKNYSFKYETGTLNVAKKALTADMFTVADTEYTYDKTAKEPVVTEHDVVSAQSLLTTTDYKAVYSKNINAGENTALITITAEADGNYTGSIEKKFSIKPRELTIAAMPAESVYNKDIAAVSYEITAGSVIAGDDLKVSAVTSVRKGYEAKNYKDAVTVRYDEKNTNYKVTTKAADYTVRMAALSVSATGYQGVYDGKAHRPEITAKTGQFLTSINDYKYLYDIPSL